MWKTILDLIFPKYCLGCNQEGNFICFNCFEKLPLNTKKIKDNLLIASYYKDPLVKKMIHSYKYDFVKDLAKPLGSLMVKKLDVIASEAKQSILVPVPLHKKRLKWRGFNQAELLAQVISRELNIPINNNLLIRTKYTLPQARIQNAQQRKENIKNSFQLVLFPPPLSFPRKRESRIKSTWIPNQVGNDKSVRHRVSNINKFQNKNIILIDDICTTRSTLEECAKILKPLKPKNIFGLIIARE